MQGGQPEQVDPRAPSVDVSGSSLGRDRRMSSEMHSVSRAAPPPSTSSKTSFSGKLFLVFIFVLLLTTIALLVSYFVVVPAYLTKKFQKEAFKVNLLELNEFNFLPNSETDLLLKTHLRMPRVYYGEELVKVQTMSGFSGLFVIVVKPAPIQELKELSNEKEVVARVDFQVKFKTPEFFQRIVLAFVALNPGLPYTVGTLYFQFHSTFCAGRMFKYDNYPAYRVLNFTGQSLKKFVRENSPKISSSKDPIFKFSNVHVDTIENGISIDFRFQHLLGLPTKVKQTMPYHLYVDDRPFLEIEFSPMHFAHENVQTKLNLRFLRLNKIQSSFFKIAAMVNGANFSSLRLVYPQQSSSPFEEHKFVLAKSSSMTLLPLPQVAKQHLAKSKAAAAHVPPIQREWDFRMTSVQTNDNNNLLIQVEIDISPSFMAPKQEFQFDRLIMDTGVRLGLFKEKIDFLQVSLSDLQAHHGKGSDKLSFQIGLDFPQGTKVPQYREAFLYAIASRNASFEPSFRFSAFPKSMEQKCHWCNAIQPDPLPLPLVLIFERMKGEKSESFKNYLDTLKKKLKKANVTSRLVHDDQGRTISQVIFKTNGLPTQLHIGSISFHLMFNGCFLMHIDTTMASDGSGLTFSVRFIRFEFQIFEKLLNQFINSYFSGTCPPESLISLASVKLGKTYESAGMVLESSPFLHFSYRKIYNRMVSNMPSLQELEQRVAALDFSKYAATEQPISKIGLSPTGISIRVLLYLKEKLPLPNIRNIYYRMQMDVDNTPVAEFQLLNLFYNNQTARLDSIFSATVVMDLVKLNSMLISWSNTLKEGKNSIGGFKSIRLKNKLLLPMPILLPNLKNVLLSVTFSLNGQPTLETEVTSLYHNIESNEFEFSVLFNLLSHISDLNPLIRGLKAVFNGKEDSSVSISTIKLRNTFALPPTLRIPQVENPRLSFDVVMDDKKVAGFAISDVVFDQIHSLVDCSILMDSGVSISKLRSLVDHYEGVLKGKHKSITFGIKNFKIQFTQSLSEPFPISTLQNSQFVFTLGYDDVEFLNLDVNPEFSYKYYPESSKADFTLSANLLATISNYPSFAKAVQASIMQGSNSAKKIKVSLASSVQVPSAWSKYISYLRKSYISVIVGMNHKDSLEFALTDVDFNSEISHLTFKISLTVLDNIRDIPSLLESFKAALNGEDGATASINAVKFRSSLPLPVTLSIPQVENPSLSFDIMMANQNVATFAISDVSFDQANSLVDYSLLVDIGVPISKLRSLVDHYEGVLKGKHKSITFGIKNFKIQFTQSLSEPFPISTLQNSQFVFTLGYDDVEFLNLDVNPEFSYKYYPESSKADFTLSANLLATISNYPSFAKAVQASIMQGSNSAKKIKVSLASSVQVPSAWSEYITKLQKSYISAIVAMSNKEILEVELSDLSFNSEISRLTFKLSITVLSSIIDIPALFEALKATLMKNYIARVTFKNVKFGSSKDDVVLSLKEIQLEELLHTIQQTSNPRSLSIEVPEAVLYEVPEIEGSDLGELAEGDDYESESMLDEDDVNLIPQSRNAPPTFSPFGPESQSSFEHGPDLPTMDTHSQTGSISSALASLREAFKYWIDYIKAKLGFGNLDPNWRTNCFGADESPVKIVKINEQLFSLTLVKCLPRSLKFEMSLLKLNFSVILGNRLLGSLVFNNNEIKMGSRLELHSQVQFVISKTQAQSALLSFLNALALHMKGELPFSEFKFLRYSLTLGDDFKLFSSEPLNPFSSSTMLTKDNMSLYLKLASNWDIDNIHFEIDSKGLHVDFGFLYSLPIVEFSFELDTLGFYIYFEDLRVVQILLERVQVSNTALTAKLSLLPIKENFLSIFKSLNPSLLHLALLDKFKIGSWFFRMLGNEQEIENNDLFIPLKLQTIGSSSLNQEATSYYRHPKSDFHLNSNFLPISSLVLIKHNKHSFRIPYFRVDVKTKSGCFSLRTKGNGITIPAKNQHVKVDISFSSMAMVQQVLEIRAYQQITHLAFGDSENDSLRLIENTPLPLGDIIKAVLGTVDNPGPESISDNWDDSFFEETENEQVSLGSMQTDESLSLQWPTFTEDELNNIVTFIVNECGN